MARMTTAALAALLGLAAPLLAAGSGPAEGEPVAEVQGADAMEAQERIQELQQRLGEIQQETFEASDELQERQQELEAQATEKMEDLGYEPQRYYDRMEEIYRRFEAGEVSEQEQRELAEAFQEAQAELQQAQREAMQDEAFRERMEADMRAFQEDLLAEMEERHPETRDLMDELRELQDQLQGGLEEHVPEGQLPEGGLGE